MQETQPDIETLPARQQPAAQEMQIPLEVKAEGPLGTFEGYGSVFGNRDRDGDIVLKGAFTESLKAGLPALLWQHDQKSPIGRFDVVREDKRGLYVKGRLSMKGRGAEAYDLLKMGALNGLSIGFVTKEASRDAASGARTIMKADLMEVSLVTFPANELARVEAVKSQTKEFGQMETTEFDGEPSDVRTFERMLRGNGFSRSRAKAITAKGFRSADLGSDESAEIAEMVAELKSSQSKLASKRLHDREMKSWGSALRWIGRALADVALGVTGAYVHDFLKDLEKTGRQRVTPQPMTLTPGERAHFAIRPRLDKKQMTYMVDALTDIKHLHFTCKINYVEWTVHGPLWKDFELKNGRSGKLLKKSVTVGGRENLVKWLKKSSKSEVDSARSRFGGSFQPYGTITYLAFGLTQDPKFSKHINKARRFIVRDA